MNEIWRNIEEEVFKKVSVIFNNCRLTKNSGALINDADIICDGIIIEVKSYESRNNFFYDREKIIQLVNKAKHHSKRWLYCQYIKSINQYMFITDKKTVDLMIICNILPEDIITMALYVNMNELKNRIKDIKDLVSIVFSDDNLLVDDKIVAFNERLINYNFQDNIE